MVKRSPADAHCKPTLIDGCDERVGVGVGVGAVVVEDGGDPTLTLLCLGGYLPLLIILFSLPSHCSHNQRSTSFRHPVTGQISPENTEYTLQDR